MRKGGFTLAEIIVAFAILTIGIVTLVLAFIQCLWTNDLNSHLSIAVIDAQSILEELKSQPFGNITGNYTPQYSYHNLPNETINISVIEDVGVKNVNLTVNWKEREGTKYFSLITEISR